MYTISFEISAFLLSLLCFLYCLTAKRKQYIPPKGIGNRIFDQHFQFLMMLTMNMISSASSVTGVYLTSLSGPGVTFWQYFFHALYFIFHTTLSLAFGLYIISVTGTRLKKNKVLLGLFFLPYIAAEILVLTNQWTGWCFYMDQDSIYHRGPLMLLLYGLAAFYVIMGFVFFIKNMKAITKADRAAVGVFILVATAGIVTQAVKSSWLVELFFESLACLVIMMVLEEKAGHIDPTTGLLNRLAFLDTARKKITAKERFSVALIRVYGTSALAKRFGERRADDFLLQFATYLSLNSDRGVCFCYRWGEFLVLFNDDVPSEYCANLVNRFRLPWKQGGIDISVDGVIASVSCPDDIRNYEELEDLLAAYPTFAKTKEGSYIVPRKQMQGLILAHAYEEELRKVVAEKKMEVHYQPIYSLKHNRTESAEALLRIPVHPFDAISPEIYIPIAEKSGLIRDIGLFVFEETCKFLSEEATKASGIRYIELNLSVYQFLDGTLVDDFEATRHKYGVPSSSINLEITESGEALNKEEVLHTLARFKALGYTLSLDDFGTGYSNFVRMIKCKFENIKIDKSILWDIKEGENGAEILKSISSFIKIQGSSIIQEGVETKEQLDLVREAGADYVQGYYFGHAMPKDGFLHYLEKEKA